MARPAALASGPERVGTGAGRTRDSRQVGGKAGSHARALCGRVDRDKDEVCLNDCFVNLCAEEEVDASLLLYNLLEARLVDGQGVRVPGCDAVRVDVDNGDGAVGVCVSAQREQNGASALASFSPE